MKQKRKLSVSKNKVNKDIRGDSIDQLSNIEFANSILAQKEIGQQNENL